MEKDISLFLAIEYFVHLSSKFGIDIFDLLVNNNDLKL